tara:strand:+ start:565 stop:780 length:216 start_codon:yes stop_codon:yes gene_type:complete
MFVTMGDSMMKQTHLDGSLRKCPDNMSEVQFSVSILKPDKQKTFTVNATGIVFEAPTTSYLMKVGDSGSQI